MEPLSSPPRRRHRCRVTPLALLGLLLLGAATVPAAGAASPPASAYVQVRGRELIAPSGEPLLLRGINLGNWLLPEGYMFGFERTASPRQIETAFAELLGDLGAARFWHEWREHYITAADVRLIRQLGLNSVRLPLNWRLFVTEEYPHRLEGPGWELLERAIGWCRDEQLWLILDLHGAPGGQTGANIDDSRGRPLLFEDPAAQDLTVALWTELARRCRDETIVLGYDLLNEPIAHYFDVDRYNPRLAPLYRRIHDAIRTVDPHHVIFLGGAQWNTNLPAAGAPFAPNLAYTFHTYWTDPTPEAIARYLAFRDEHDVPLWLGESGENTDEWISRFRQVLEAHDIGWCFWPYKKLTATSCIATIPAPPHWEQIVAYAEAPRGDFEQIRAALPPLELTQQVFRQLLDNLRLENTRLNPGYLEALGLSAPPAAP